MSIDRIKEAMAKFNARVDVGKVPQPRKAKRKRPKDALPTEYQEQAIVCDWLKLHGIVYCSVPNGASFGGDARVHAIRLKRVGMKPGVPDLLIFEPMGPFVGCAVEMKRQKGGSLSEAQDQWLRKLRELGWATVVGHGAKNAIEELEVIGYGDKK